MQRDFADLDKKLKDAYIKDAKDTLDTAPKETEGIDGRLGDANSKLDDLDKALKG